jgi:hypothetical protein
MKVRGDPRTETLSGRCYAQAPFLVVVERRGDVIDWYIGSTEPGSGSSDGGTFRVVAFADLRRGDRLSLSCRTPSGDFADVSGAVSVH